MLDNTITKSLINRAATRSLHGEIEKDIRVINDRLVRAELFLSQLKGANFQPLAPGVKFNDIKDKAKINAKISRKFSAELKFSTREYYLTYVVGLLFNFLGEINAAADVFGTSIDLIYRSIGGTPFPGSPYLFGRLTQIKADTNGYNLTTFLNDSNHIALIDSNINHFLPNPNPGNIDINQCNFSYSLVRRIRNKLEHNSYEGFVSFVGEQPQMSAPVFYAIFSDDADQLCNTTNIFSSLSKKPGGGRDIIEFCDWTLEKFPAYLTDMIVEVINDM